MSRTFQQQQSRTMMFLTSVYLVSYILLVEASENEIDPSATHPIHPKSPASVLHDEVDILKLINVSNKDPGISLVEGPITHFPAYKFRLPYGNVALSNSSIVNEAFSSPEGFTLVFLYRQQKINLGTLLSINSPGRLTPWFQLISNSKTGMLSMKYRLKKKAKLKQIDWELPRHHRKSPLAAWTWAAVIVDYKTGIVRLDLDCQPSHFELLSSELDRISIPQDSLVYFRQEPGRKKKFLGSMQVAKVLPYPVQNRLWTCMQISFNLSPEFRKPIMEL